jgi:hypothetical protein
MHLIEPISERLEKFLMGLERSLQIPKDVINVMAQTKRLAEDATHLYKRFKEMARAPKEKKEN